MENGSIFILDVNRMNNDSLGIEITMSKERVSKESSLPLESHVSDA